MSRTFKFSCNFLLIIWTENYTVVLRFTLVNLSLMVMSDIVDRGSDFRKIEFGISSWTRLDSLYFYYCCDSLVKRHSGITSKEKSV